MAELVPAPLSDLVRRLFAEYSARRAIFDLPQRAFWCGDERHDLSVRFHGDLASTPLGPAAGPQSQLAQNIVLAWLAGARILELKTVQINDRLTIPRPCIDARTIGYNVEWSQELRIADSQSEYVHAWMLIALLRAAGLPSARAAGPQGHTLFDLSVGYDLKGISSAPVRAFIEGLRDARAAIDARRSALPPRFRDIEIDPCIGRSITLSTFHGCPAGEIEQICEFLLGELGVHTVVKMNPTLLGLEAVQHLLHDVLGYHHVALDPATFEHDLRWDEALGLVRRLESFASARGLGFGVKFSNTLVVQNTDTYFSEPVMYLSGQPLYVLAATLALRFRDAYGAHLPISFSAGIDQHNVVDGVAMGFVPVTMCTDLLRPGGYARLSKYLGALGARMDALGAETRDALVRLSAAPAEEDLATAAHRNARAAVESAHADPRYRASRLAKPPRKLGSHLSLFDCISCDKCVPVCPNDANFVYETRPRTLALDELVVEDGRMVVRRGPRIEVERRHQLANFADFCNECGNCDVFCPEDGGPFIEKPRFFAREADYQADKRVMGFHLTMSSPGRIRLLGRLRRREYTLEADFRAGVATFTDGVLAADLTIRTGALRRATELSGAREGHSLSLGAGREMLALLDGLLDPSRPTPVNAPWLAEVPAWEAAHAAAATSKLTPLPRDPNAPRDIC
jgi:putative selenate reductase